VKSELSGNGSTRLADAVVPILDEALTGLSTELARVCRYHFGWPARWDEPGSEPRPSKYFRATLVLLAARGYGGGNSAALAVAAAIEMLHNSTLLCDDIIDDDRVRRSRPAAWVEFGPHLATLASEALAAAAVAQLTSAGVPQTMLSSLMTTYQRVLGGMAFEVASLGRTTLTIDDFVHLARDKTGALLQCGLTLGATSAGASESSLEALGAAGLDLGVAWQAANDVEDIWADPASTGKPARGDLRRRQPTLPVLLALQSPTDAGRQLRMIWSTTSTDEPTLAQMGSLIEQTGARQTAEQISTDFLDQALSNLAQADLSPAVHEELYGLFRRIAERTPPLRNEQRELL
jgi:geranylgeranyl diphosphate synthase type I